MTQKIKLSMLIVLVCGLTSNTLAQVTTRQNKVKAEATILQDSHFVFETSDSPSAIRLSQGRFVTPAAFFAAYKQIFDLPQEIDFRVFRQNTDEMGQTHRRYQQYYKGIQVIDAQYILHSKNGNVFYANGELAHKLELEVTPRLSETAALQNALQHIGAENYMWDSAKNEVQLKREQNDRDASFYPKGTLKISAAFANEAAHDARLVYRFDIYALKPFGRYFVDVDANSGEIVNTISRIQTGDVQGQGESRYNGTVPIIVSDADYPPIPDVPSRWHLDAWNAFGGSGQGWWAADPSLGNQGGYENTWYEALDTDEILLSGTGITLTFRHRYSVETAGGEPDEYNGWDGMNVRISVDGGSTWQVLSDPVPAYTHSSLYSFGNIHGEGPGIPGWTDAQLSWTQATIDLAAFTGQTIRLRFAFASDGGYSTTDGGPHLFGWQIDDILVSNSNSILYSNNGVPEGMTASNLVREATIIAGNYRLRESGRGSGIFTYDMANQETYGIATDFVDEDTLFADSRDQAGVSVHWAAEATYDYYAARHARNGLDGADRRIISYAHFGQNLSNAFWDGTRTNFGDGPSNQIPFTSIDIVAHEMTHGVTQFSAGLNYFNEPGALNESFSDIFGELVESYLKDTEPDWVVGADALSLRSFSNPKLRFNPDTYLGNFWVPETQNPNPDNDQGGVHTNSGVQNHWFYLVSEGGAGKNDWGLEYAVTGIGLEKAAQIAYRNLTAYLTPTSGLLDARRHSIDAAIDLYGQDSAEQLAVTEAWFAVGVNQSPVAAPETDTLEFQVQAPAVADTAEITVFNRGNEILSVNDATIQGARFQLIAPAVFPLVIEGGKSGTFRIVFVSDGTPEKIGSLNIASNDPRSPTHAVLLRGRYSAMTTAVDDFKSNELPSDFVLRQNYPNPFNPVTTIGFSLPEKSEVAIKIFDILGRELQTLVDGQFDAGSHEVAFDAGHLPSGIYLYQIKAAEFTQVRKLILMK